MVIALIPLDCFNINPEDFDFHSQIEPPKLLLPIFTLNTIGKFMGIYKSGFHWFPGWYEVQYLVNTQHLPYHFKIKECPTRDNVQIKVSNMKTRKRERHREIEG